MPASYLDLATKRQAILERVKSGHARDFVKELEKLDKLIRVSILSLDSEVAELSRTRLEALVADLRKQSGEIFKAATEQYLATLPNLAAVVAAQEVIDLAETVDVTKTRLGKFTKKDLYRKVIQRPLSVDGDLLESFVGKFSDVEKARVAKVIRAGAAQGQTNQELVKRMVGTKARNYQDGAVATTRRNARAVVRTSVQHVASSARQEVWEANRDVVSRYEFIATLDRVTSPICRTLDQQEFEFGKGPIPPVHPNCRSTHVAILDEKFKFLSNGRTRSAEQGPVKAETTYYEWLKRQTKADQETVLGKRKAKLFRDGGMTAERFRALQFDKNFDPLTLEEMRVIEPEAFKRAGL